MSDAYERAQRPKPETWRERLDELALDSMFANAVKGRIVRSEEIGLSHEEIFVTALEVLIRERQRLLGACLKSSVRAER